MPLASVVLPAPRLPISNTAARGGSSRASISPSAMVSSSDDVRNFGTLLHGRGQVAQQVGGDQALFAQFCCPYLAGKPVQIHGRGNRLLGVMRELGEKPGEET